MGIKVVKNKIFHGSKTYEVGDIIENGLSKEEEDSLVDSGVAEYQKNDKKKTLKKEDV